MTMTLFQQPHFDHAITTAADDLESIKLQARDRTCMPVQCAHVRKSPAIGSPHVNGVVSMTWE